MDTGGEMRAFVRVVEHQSFSAAATILDLTPSAVSKLISRLEDRLGVRLLRRTTRRLALTPEGELYFARARQISLTSKKRRWRLQNREALRAAACTSTRTPDLVCINSRRRCQNF